MNDTRKLGLSPAHEAPYTGNASVSLREPEDVKLIYGMVDIETDGTKPGCAVLQIGAVFVDPMTDSVLSGINERISRISCIEHGLTNCSASTMEFWYSQPDDTRDYVFGGTSGLQLILLQFSGIIGDLRVRYPNASIQLWSKGMDFDFPILEAAYIAAELPVPWKYYETNDYRTIKKLTPELEAAPRSIECTLHDAYHDAVYQLADLLMRIRALKAPRK